MEILSNALTGPEQHMAEYVYGVFRFVFDTTGKADGAYHLRITDAWEFKTVSQDVSIRTVVYTPVASGQVNADRSVWTQINDPANVFTGRMFWKFLGQTATAGVWYEPVYLNIAGQGREAYNSYWIKNYTDGPVFLRMVVREMSLARLPVYPDEMHNAAIDYREALPSPPGDAAAVRQQTVPNAAGGGGLCFIDTAAQGWTNRFIGLVMLVGILLGLWYRRKPVL